MTNYSKAFFTVFTLAKPKVCHYGVWAKQKRVKLPSMKYRVSNDHEFVLPNQLTTTKKSVPNHLDAKQLKFDVSCQYYNLLDIRQDATIQEIRSSYFRLAKKFHPDAFYVERSTDADEQFAKLTEAYEVLCDPRLRSEYDRFLMKTEKPKNIAEVSSKMAILLNNNILSELSKINKTVPKIEVAPIAPTHVGNIAPIHVKPISNVDSAVEVHVPFMHAITGQIHHANLRFSSVCPSCQKSNHRGCFTCHGSGQIPVEKVVPIRIPAAVDDGQVLTLMHPIDGKENLKIRVKIEKHPHFARDKLDIVTTTKIPWLVGLLGGEITVKSVYGEIIPISIRPGSDSHTKIRLAGKGVRSTHATGDHLVIVKIIMPEKLSEQQKRILLQYF